MTRNMTISSILFGALSFGCTPQGGDQGQETGADETIGATDGASETGKVSGDEPDTGTEPETGDDIDLTGGSESGTTAVDPTCGFICPTEDTEDDPILECDVFVQDCPEDQKCAAWANDGGTSWNATKCVPVTGNKVPGDPCTVEGSGVSGLDDCEKGSMCWDTDEENNGVCVALCTGNQDSPECADTGTACAVVNDGVLNLCLDRCDPLIQDCGGDDLCLPIDDAYVCVLDASGDQGAAFSPCEFANACDPGLLCLSPSAATECDQGALGCCLPFCPISENGADCPGANQSCLAVFEPQLPGFEDVGYCSLTQ